MKYLFSAMEAKLSLVDSGKNITILTLLITWQIWQRKQQRRKNPLSYVKRNLLTVT